MSGVWLDAVDHNLLIIEAIELRLVSHIKGMTENGLRRIIVLLIVQSVHASKIRNSALRGDPRSAEKYDSLGFVYHFLQSFYFFQVHSPPPYDSSVNSALYISRLVVPRSFAISFMADFLSMP